MDTSETYIKMCEKAEEIQRLCVGETGDFVYLTKALEGYNGWQDYEGRQVKVVGNDGEYDITFGYPYDSPYETLKADGLIWLPRQDQLQKMIDFEPFIYNLTRLLEFMPKYCGSRTGWVEPHILELYSMEQVWFAFVMRELYKKTWNGHEWSLFPKGTIAIIQ